MKLNKFKKFLVAFAACQLFAAPAFGSFYDGKTLTIVGNYPAGGANDIEARIIGKHLGKHLGEDVQVIVKAMPGGGGNIASNFLGESAEKDGMTLGFFTWNPIDQIIDAPGLRVDYSDFDYIAGIAHPTIFYARKDLGDGLASPLDIVNAKDCKAGTYSPTIHQTVRTRLVVDLLEIDCQVVTGYKGGGGVNTAMLQDEVQLSNISIPGYRGAVVPTLVEPGLVIPLFSFDSVTADGGFEKNYAVSVAMPELPTFLEVYKHKFGADAFPSGEQWELLDLINRIMETIYRTILMSPDSPDEAVADMVAAFEALAEDPEFVADYEKTVGIEPRMTIGASGEEAMSSLSKIDEGLKTYLKKYLSVE